MRCRLGFAWILLMGVFAAGCASTEEPKGRYHQATYINDIFQVEQGMPMREVKKNQDFFFKKCEMAGRQPFFSKAEYECTELP